MASNEASPQKREKLSLLWQFLKGAKRYFLVTVLAAGVTSLADMLQPQIIRAAVDCALGGKEGDFPAFVMNAVDSIGGFAYLGQHLWIMASAILAIAVIQVISQYTFRVYNTKASETLVKSMRDQLFSHIERLPFSWHMKNRTGDIIQRCTSDIDTTKNFLSEQLTSVFKIVILLIFSIFFMGINAIRVKVPCIETIKKMEKIRSITILNTLVNCSDRKFLVVSMSEVHR